MTHLDHTGPEGNGPKTGRKLGRCKKNSDEQQGELGKGMGKNRNNCQEKEPGKGKRINNFKNK